MGSNPVNSARPGASEHCVHTLWPSEGFLWAENHHFWVLAENWKWPLLVCKRCSEGQRPQVNTLWMQPEHRLKQQGAWPTYLIIWKFWHLQSSENRTPADVKARLYSRFVLRELRFQSINPILPWSDTCKSLCAESDIGRRGAPTITKNSKSSPSMFTAAVSFLRKIFKQDGYWKAWLWDYIDSTHLHFTHPYLACLIASYTSYTFPFQQLLHKAIIKSTLTPKHTDSSDKRSCPKEFPFHWEWICMGCQFSWWQLMGWQVNKNCPHSEPAQRNEALHVLFFY